ncbi:MAG: acetate--CoA ligase family protein [Nitrososphaerota archaeon]
MGSNFQERFLTEPECYQLLKEKDFPVSPFAFCQSAEEACLKAQEIGFPLVIKIVSPDVIHKSDVGGVIVGVKEKRSLKKAYYQILRNVKSNIPNARIQGVLIQPFFHGGLEVIVGGLLDSQFGPAVMFGLGGIFVELLKDVTFRVAPFGMEEAKRMIKEVKGFSLLQGYRGKDPLDVEGLVFFLSKVSQFMYENPRVIELDLNPVFLFPWGLVISDARMKVSSEL